MNITNNRKRQIFHKYIKVIWRVALLTLCIISKRHKKERQYLEIKETWTTKIEEYRNSQYHSSRSIKCGSLVGSDSLSYFHNLDRNPGD